MKQPLVYGGLRDEKSTGLQPSGATPVTKSRSKGPSASASHTRGVPATSNEQ